MPCLWPVVALAALLPVTLTAQASRSGWAVGLSVSHLGFDGASHDVVSVPGTPLEVQPNSRLGIEGRIAYEWAGWEGAVSAGYANGHVLASNGSTSIEDQSIKLKRVRIAAALSKVVLRPGSGRLLFGAGPALDRWSGDIDHTHWRLGAGAHLALWFPVGRLELEDRIEGSISGSSFTEPDVAGSNAELQNLWTLAIGFGLRVRP